MKPPKMVTGKWLCSLASFIVVAGRAQEQTPPSDWGFHVRAGPMVGLNIRASFKNSGPLSLAANQPAGVYDDGYVRTDQTGSAGGLTSYWGYQNAAQVNAPSHTLLMHQAATFSAATAGSSQDEPYFGAEVAAGGDLWRWDQWHLGWELGCGVLPISIRNQQTQPVNVNRNIFSFNTGNIVVPTAPYNGGPSGVGPLIHATGAQLAGDTVAGSYTGTQTLETTLIALKLGPTLFWELSHYVGLQAGAGPAIGVLPGSLNFDDSVQLADGSTHHNSSRIGSTPLVFGGYLSLVATFHIAKHADIYLGAEYLPLENANFGASGRGAELKLGGQADFMAGLNWPF